MTTPFEVRGYDHIKVALQDIERYEKILECFGFSPVSERPEWLQSPHSVWGSGEAFFVLYPHDHPLAAAHHQLHGDTVFDLCFRVESNGNHPPEYEGVGKMKHTIVTKRTFEPVEAKAGLYRVDHNTLNLERGTLESTVQYYLNTFGFNKGQYFHIQGKETGLYSQVTRCPDSSVQIPFNEAADDKSQIQEYIVEHKGAGVQHMALLSDDLIKTMDYIIPKIEELGVHFLDTPDTYYELAETRVKIRESIDELQKRRILVDQDESGGYLLQIFTSNLFSAVFFELIQREGNTGFGEGNFQALFDAMELDQKRRGVI